MPDSAQLLAAARQLLDPQVPSPATDATLRRAVSTAYYALFHKISQAAALRFIGVSQQQTAAYTLIYRSFDHRQMKSVCESLQATTLSARLQRQLGRRSMSHDTRRFADAFQDLQNFRHLADYDPAYHFRAPDVHSIIDQAAEAMAAFDRIAPAEQTDILALLMVKSRD